VQDAVLIALALAALAGLSIPVGAWLGSRENLFPRWLEDEFRHTIIAFGGGALLAAVALVLVPEGVRYVSPVTAMLAFCAGGAVFWLVDSALERRGGHGAQFMAMLLDYVPEAMALGALLSDATGVAVLMAGLIMVQNLPEGFNAYREMEGGKQRKRRSLFWLFVLVVPFGPLAAWLGVSVLASNTAVLGAIMLFAAGGIVYLLFEDVAPQVRLERRWSPPLGAVAGFALGLAGSLATA